MVWVGDEGRGRQLRREADEPGRLVAVGGAALAGHRAFITACTIGEVCQPPQLPSAAPYPVTHRAASVTARATLPAAHRRAGVSSGTSGCRRSPVRLLRGGGFRRGDHGHLPHLVDDVVAAVGRRALVAALRRIVRRGGP
jgi:hypothetical protein